MNDREKIATLICLGTDDSCKEHCNLPSGKVCVRCEALADCLLAHGVTVQKHGRWSYDEEASKWGFPFLCSACHKAHDHKEPFCPNCGAKMLSEDDFFKEKT